MFAAVKNHLRDARGEVYIEMLICLTVFLIAGVIIFSVASSLTTKLWLDERLSDISKLVDSTGTTKSDAISKIENSIKARIGGEVSYTANFIDDDPDKGLVQLNERVLITYHNDKYVVTSVLGYELATEINIFKTAVSSIYYKPDTLID